MCFYVSISVLFLAFYCFSICFFVTEFLTNNTKQLQSFFQSIRETPWTLLWWKLDKWTKFEAQFLNIRTMSFTIYRPEGYQRSNTNTDSSSSFLRSALQLTYFQSCNRFPNKNDPDKVNLMNSNLDNRRENQMYCAAKLWGIFLEAEFVSVLLSISTILPPCVKTLKRDQTTPVRSPDICNNLSFLRWYKQEQLFYCSQLKKHQVCAPSLVSWNMSDFSLFVLHGWLHP